jgi:hypothetical protein
LMGDSRFETCLFMAFSDPHLGGFHATSNKQILFRAMDMASKS